MLATTDIIKCALPYPVDYQYTQTLASRKQKNCCDKCCSGSSKI